MVAVPGDIPVTIPLPVTLPLTAPVLHMPPLTASLRVAVMPTHTSDRPVIAVGAVFTVTVIAAAQPEGAA